MSFNRLSEKSSTKGSFKWSVLIVEKGECSRPTGTNFENFITFVFHKRLANGLQSIPRHFANDTSLFSTVQDITTRSASLNNDLTKIFEWAAQWKMNFNSDPSKQELLYTRKTNSKPYPSLNFNDNPVH